MNSLKLIELVRKRKSLWDTGHRLYRNRDVARKLWDEIAEELCTQRHVVKSKWGNLRDHFRKEYLRVSKTFGSTGQTVSRWSYYQPLSFLADVIVTRNTPNSHHPSSTNDVDTSVRHNNNNSDREGPLTPNLSQHESDVSSDSTPIKVEIDSTQHARFNGHKWNPSPSFSGWSEEFKMRSTTHDEDSDYHFLMSLLPFLRDIPKSSKLLVRQHMYDVLMEAQAHAASLSHPAPNKASTSRTVPQEVDVKPFKKMRTRRH